MTDAIAALAKEFHSAYSDYLTQLGETVRQQLILASYYVCTQGYPERFLKLSYNQRYELQQTLRRLSQQTQEELLAQLHPPDVYAESEIPKLPEPLELFDELSGETPKEIAQDPPVETEVANGKSAKPQLTPSHLAQWQQDLENAIAEDLKTASHAANRLMQQAGILPPKLPEPVLEAASKADVSEIGGRTPNLMNLLIETVAEDPGEKLDVGDLKGHAVMHIVAVHLRIAEIEFSNPALTSCRTRIRSLLAQLKTSGREYQKKQKERAIAEAQAVWRSTWSEE